MTDLDRLVGEFVEDWNAGSRPDVDDFLRRAAPAERDELAERLGAWLLVAPTPDYDTGALAAIRAEPALAAARAAVADPDPAAEWSLALARARRRAGIGTRQLAARLAGALRLGDEAPRVAVYLERLEAGELDERRVSRRLVDALADALGDAGAAVRAAAAPAPTPSVAWFRADDAAGEAFGDALEALSRAAATPAPASMDEVERLFCGGPDA
jgi:GNAT superfamily N-acetyltransferase